MLKASTRWLRFSFALALALLFAWQAWVLFRRQQEKFSLQSFRIENESGFVILPNLDKLKQRLQSALDLGMEYAPEDLVQAVNHALGKKELRWSEVISQSASISWNEKDFAITFNTGAKTASQLVDLVNQNFEAEAVLTESGMHIATRDLLVETYHNYLVISTQSLVPQAFKSKAEYGNADYISYSQGATMPERHILTDGFHHEIYLDSASGPSGAPVYNDGFLKFIPANFNFLRFYGSHHFSADRLKFFGEEQTDEFSWVDQGIIYLRKDSFELLIAPQNVDQDLRLILEEHTLALIGDTNDINYFNIGPYQVMPFQTVMNWQNKVEGMIQNPAFFTILESYNVLANSIPAMRWYLGEVQLGNLFLKNPSLTRLFYGMIPQRTHIFEMTRQDAMDYYCSSKIWISPLQRVNTSTRVSGGVSEQGGASVDLLADFEIPFIPEHLQFVQIGDSTGILASNAKEVGLYNLKGDNYWKLNLTTPLIGKPQPGDFENDGQSEFVLFQQDQVDVIQIKGHSAPGFPVHLTGTCKGGLLVNYDDSYNYRILINQGTQVRSMDENGQFVQGWSFAGMSAELKGAVSYFVTAGKDMIAFKDLSNKQYVLNRRGESRLMKEAVVNLPNESAFVVGNFDTGSLRKLGYRNGCIVNYYLLDGHTDSVKLDRPVEAVSAQWLFNNNKPLLVIEETGRVVVIDEFGYETQSVLKPVTNQFFAGLVVDEGFRYVFVDNSQNALYLLNGYGKMIFPVPVAGTSVFECKNGMLCTFVGTKIKVYKTD